MKVTWYGTASLCVQAGQGRLLVDPFVPLRGSGTRVNPSAYEGFEAVLVTHGHFDHIMSLPALIRDGRPQIYCTRTPAQTLQKLGVPRERISVFVPGDALELEGVKVSVYRSRHVRYDGPVLRRTLLNVRMLRHAYNLPRVVEGLLRYPERGETVAFLIEGEAKRVMVLGSLNLAGDVDYPSGADLLVLPYQGRSDLLTPALEIIERLRPRAVLLDHFDDAFPPISAGIDTSDIVRALAGALPVYCLEPGGSLEI